MNKDEVDEFNKQLNELSEKLVTAMNKAANYESTIKKQIIENNEKAEKNIVIIGIEQLILLLCIISALVTNDSIFLHTAIGLTVLNLIVISIVFIVDYKLTQKLIKEINDK